MQGTALNVDQEKIFLPPRLSRRPIPGDTLAIHNPCSPNPFATRLCSIYFPLYDLVHVCLHPFLLKLTAPFWYLQPTPPTIVGPA